MSILIKGMEMPDSCHVCVAGYGGCCYVAPPEEDGICPDHGRAGWCPLVSVQPHGDLIDRDPFIDFIKSHWDSYDQWFVDQLEARPTIIEAEEGDT